MPRTGRTAIKAFHRFVPDKGQRVSIRIHFGIARRKHEIASMLGDQFRIFFQTTRVFVQVFIFAKLNRVQKDAHDGHIVFFDGRIDKARMPAVQSAHRRHDANGFSHFFQGKNFCAEFRNRFDNFHEISLQEQSMSSG